jgi:hypothetical protein
VLFNKYKKVQVVFFFWNKDLYAPFSLRLRSAGWWLVADADLLPEKNIAG